MSRYSIALPHFEQRSFREISLHAIDDQIDAIESGDLRLRIPRIRHQFEVSKGNHFHLRPELFIQVSGLSTMRFPHERIHSRAGTVLIVPRGVPHTERARYDHGPFCNLIFAHTQKGIHAHISFQGPGSQPKIHEMRALAIHNADKVPDYLDQVVGLRFRPERLETSIRGLMLAYFGFVREAWSRKKSTTVIEPFKVLQCRRLIHEHLSLPELNVQQLARWIACSPDYLSHCYRKETGTTLTRYINAERIRLAQELLDRSTMNIAEVAQACGYADPGYFSRQFRRIMQKTPQAYRKRQRIRHPPQKR